MRDALKAIAASVLFIGVAIAMLVAALIGAPVKATFAKKDSESK